MPSIPITWQNLTNAIINGDGDLEKNAGSDQCFTNASGSGDAGARSVQVITAGDFEFRCTLGYTDGTGKVGRSFVGISTGALNLNFGLWRAALHVSTEANTSGTPHPPDSIFAYQGGAPNKTYLDGLWVNNTLLKITCRNGVLRAYVNSFLFYVYSVGPVYPVHAAASLACLNKTVVDPLWIVGDGSTPVACEEGAESPIEDCAASWVMPTPAPLPLPSNGGPRPGLFQEMDGDWGEFGNTFPDGKPQFNTIQSEPIRKFVVIWDVDPDDAAIIDAHYDSTRGGLKFNVTHPYTGEVITGVRYKTYERPAHQKVWAQQRRAELIRYTN